MCFGLLRSRLGSMSLAPGNITRRAIAVSLWDFTAPL